MNIFLMFLNSFLKIEQFLQKLWKNFEKSWTYFFILKIRIFCQKRKINEKT
jgi:hypothetical protein